MELCFPSMVIAAVMMTTRRAHLLSRPIMNTMPALMAIDLHSDRVLPSLRHCPRHTFAPQ